MRTPQESSPSLRVTKLRIDDNLSDAIKRPAHDANRSEVGLVIRHARSARLRFERAFASVIKSTCPRPITSHEIHPVYSEGVVANQQICDPHAV